MTKTSFLGKNTCHILSLIVFPLLFFMILSCAEPEDPPVRCKTDERRVEIPPQAPVRIGVLQAMTGKAVALGTEQIRGIELAVEARNGKLAGRDIVIQKEDTACSSEGGSNAALKISSDPQTVAVIGTTCSIAAASASKILSDAGFVMISGNNSAPFLTTVGGVRAPQWQRGYFRTAGNDENAGRAAAIYAFTELGAKRGAAINDGDIYTRGLTTGFEDEFTSLGGEIVLSTTVNKGDQDMSPVLAAVKYTRADIIFFPLFQPEGNRILIQARATPGLEDIILMSDGALIESTFIKNVAENGRGMFFVGPAKPETDASNALEKKYIAKYGSNPLTSYYLNAFDAADILFTAIETVAVMESDGTLHVDRDNLRNALYATRNFNGVTGILNCDEFGDCTSPRFNILRLDDFSLGLEGLESNIVYYYAPK